MTTRALFLSDTHIFTESASPDMAVLCIKKYRPRQVYLIGDILDLWVSPDARNEIGDARHFLRFMLQLADSGIPITYCIGNHDTALKVLKGLDIDGIRVVRDCIHVTGGGAKYYVCHGDQFDSWMQYRTLGIIASRAYNWVRLRKWSLAEYIMRQADGAASDLEAFEKAACRAARKRGCFGIICGHTHCAGMSTRRNTEYWNCGMSADNCILERENGALEIVRICAGSHNATTFPKLRGTHGRLH